MMKPRHRAPIAVQYLHKRVALLVLGFLSVVLILSIFNTTMQFVVAKEARRVAQDDDFGRAFQTAEYVGQDDLGVLFLGVPETPY